MYEANEILLKLTKRDRVSLITDLSTSSDVLKYPKHIFIIIKITIVTLHEIYETLRSAGYKMVAVAIQPSTRTDLLHFLS